MRPFTLIACVLALICSFARADVRISLPLDGYYRTGRYAAIAIDAPPTQQLKLRGNGVVSLEIDAGGQAIHGIYPLLVFDQPAQTFRATADGANTDVPLALRPLAENDRLVGVIGTGGEDRAKQLFPGKSIIPIKLDPNKPFAGAPAAWDALDAVIAEQPTTMDEQIIRHLLPAGTIFSVRSSDPPDKTWPWAREGDWWTLRYEALGPPPSLAPTIASSAYGPVASVPSGALRLTRVMVIFLAILFTIVALGASLLPRIACWPALTVVVSSAFWTFHRYDQRLPSLREAEGGIVTLTREFRQTDSWTFQTSVRPTQGPGSFNAITRPILTSPEQARAMDLTLICGPDGSPYLFYGSIAPHDAMVYWTRSLNPRGDDKVQALLTARSPLRPLAQDLYLVPGARIAGEGPQERSFISYIQRWPTVIIDRIEPATEPASGPASD